MPKEKSERRETLVMEALKATKTTCLDRLKLARRSQAAAPYVQHSGK